jgi:hypothetical protein
MKQVGLAALAAWMLVVVPAPGQTPEEKQATIAYVRGLQVAGSGFRPDAKADQPTLRATSAALRALSYLGGGPRDLMGAADFVQRCYDKASGGFADMPGGKPDVFTTAVGVMAVKEAKLPLEPFAEPVLKYFGGNVQSFEDIRIAAAGLERLGQPAPQARAWLEQIHRLKNSDGTWGKGKGTARMTGSAAVVVLRLGDKLPAADSVLQALKAGQRGDGGFGREEVDTSDLETSYRVLRAFVMLRHRPEKPDALRAFVARCRNTDGGYGLSPGQPSAAGPTYFAAIILHWLDDPRAR